MVQLQKESGTAEEHTLDKEARKWASRVAREYKSIIHTQKVRTSSNTDSFCRHQDKDGVTMSVCVFTEVLYFHCAHIQCTTSPCNAISSLYYNKTISTIFCSVCMWCKWVIKCSRSCSVTVVVHVRCEVVIVIEFFLCYFSVVC